MASKSSKKQPFHSRFTKSEDNPVSLRSRHTDDRTLWGILVYRFKDIMFEGNSFNAINYQVSNPLRVTFTQGTAAKTWTVPTDALLPFQAWARGVNSVTAVGQIDNASGQTIYTMPFVKAKIGTNKDHVQLVWSENVLGTVDVTIRVDD